MHIPADVAVLRNPVVARIMLVASEGERDPEKLKAAALGDIRLKPVCLSLRLAQFGSVS